MKELQSDSMESFLSEVVEQIKYKPMEKEIRKELINHIEDSQIAYIESGMMEEEAMNLAIRRMGDPVETGVKLDKIHSPKFSYSFACIVIILSVIGIVIQCVIMNEIGDSDLIKKAITFGSVSIVIMILINYFDYSYINQYYIPILILIVICTLITVSNGTASWWYHLRVMAYNFLTLLIPIFAASVYRMKEKGIKGILLLEMFMFIIVVLAASSNQITGIVEFLLSSFAIVMVAILKGWFGNNKKIHSFVLLAPISMIGILGMTYILVFKGNGVIRSNRIVRILEFFNYTKFGDRYYYMANNIRYRVNEFTLFGNNSLLIESSGLSHNDYIISNIANYFGIIVLTIVLLLVLLCGIKALIIAFLQVNTLGCFIAVGCTVSLFTKSVIYVLSNLGIGLFTQMSMPFLSYGILNSIANAVLAGLIMSVFRYTNIMPESRCEEKFTYKIIRLENDR